MGARAPGQAKAKFVKDFYKKCIRKSPPGRRGSPGPDLLRISFRNVLENDLPAAGGAHGQIR